MMKVAALQRHFPNFSHDIDELDHLDDELGRGDLARGIADEIRKSPDGLGPRVIGIYGWWGAGKSYLLSQIIRHLLAGNETDTERGIVVVRYRTWEYETQGDLTPGLILSMRNVDQQYRHTNPSNPPLLVGRGKSSYKEQANMLLKTVLRTTAFAVGMAAAMLPQGQALTSMIQWYTSSTIRDVNQARRRASNHGKLAPYEDDAVQRIKAEMQSLVDGIIEAARAGNEKRKASWRVVVFIDDLDRCSPENMVNMFEWLKVHLVVDHCVYVLALDHVAAARAIVGRYKEYLGDDPDLSYGFRYLEKLVDRERELVESPNVQRMALIQMYGQNTRYSTVSDVAKEQSGGDFPGIIYIDELLSLRSLATPRTVLKIVDKYLRVLDVIDVQQLQHQLPSAYHVWILFMIAVYYRLDPDDLAKFVRGQGPLYQLLLTPEKEQLLRDIRDPLLEFCHFAQHLGKSGGEALRPPSSEVLHRLANIILQTA